KGGVHMAIHKWTDCEGFHRRDFLKIGAGAGLFGLTLPQLLQLEAQAKKETVAKRKADAVIMVWLAGGASTIDMWDLKPDAPEGIRGEFKPITTKVKGVQISEHLPQVAQVLDKVTLVRSLAHTVPAHGPATLFMTTGNQPTPALHYPALGSLAARLLPGDRDVPHFVSFSSGRAPYNYAGYLGTTYNPFIVETTDGKGKIPRTPANLQVRGILLPTGFTLQELENRVKLLEGFDRGLKALDQSPLGEGLDAFHKQALEILRSDRTRKAFDLTEEPSALRERYGATSFGQGALAARRLVEAGVRFVTISLGGWDTHQRNFESLSKTLLPQLDQTLSALLDDLDRRGRLGRTIVYCAGEFGRTPKINGGGGGGHWGGAVAGLVAGGGV